MPAMTLLPNDFCARLFQFTALEIALLENLIFEEICCEINLLIKQQRKPYCQSRKVHDKEDEMLECELFSYVVNDMINSGHYDLAGLSLYTRIPEEVLFDIAMGTNPNPSHTTSKRILAVYRSVRPELYQRILQKIIDALDKAK